MSEPYVRSTYQVITDEIKLREFIEWLPDVAENEKFYACLFMRKKYCPEVPWIKSDKGQLKRFVSDKVRLYDKIRQLECTLGSYKFDTNDVPQESLALYITPNPRDLYKATLRGIAALAKVIECKGSNSNPHQEILSEIQRTPATGRTYVTFDLDWKDETKIQNFIDVVDGYCDVIETRGGYHLHVHKNKIDKIKTKLWHNEIAKEADVSGDAMTPVVGTYQGGWSVQFIYRCQD